MAPRAAAGSAESSAGSWVGNAGVAAAWVASPACSTATATAIRSTTSCARWAGCRVELRSSMQAPAPGGTMSDDLPDFSNVKGGSSTTATKIYTVVSGDSLSKIAKREYGNANEWNRIYDAN